MCAYCSAEAGAGPSARAVGYWSPRASMGRRTEGRCINLANIGSGLTWSRCSLRQRVVVDSVVVVLVAAAAGLETSSPVVSFSIITPRRLSVRRVVVVTSTSCVAGATCVDSVVVLEYDDCAKPTPDIKKKA